jgi:predicted phage baseplate assembly protein
VWNPFDVVDGSDPEPVESILRAAPEAYRARQLRAVTLADYVRRAEEVEGVARAMARYFWTGSWRTVRVLIDPDASHATSAGQLRPALKREVMAHLEAVRLIGEDLEIRAPKYVPLEIEVRLCLYPDVWPEDVRWRLEQEFSTGWTAQGRRGFFHPDEWTFGQALHRSQIEGRVHQVPGVEHLLHIHMRRFHALSVASTEVIHAGVEEILQVLNDPDNRERGMITFDLRGGRQA